MWDLAISYPGRPALFQTSAVLECQSTPMLSSDRDPQYFTSEQLPQPYRAWVERLEAHRDHPAYRWFYSIGNGFFEDDTAVSGLPVPGPVYRFRRDGLMAYVWVEGELWIVRPWQRTRGRVSNVVERMGSLRAALDVLVRKRPWWKFWG